MNDLDRLLAKLTEEDRETAASMLGLILLTLHSEKGAVLVFADSEGSGTAAMIAGGNEKLVPLLMASAGDVARSMYHTPEGVVLQ